MRTPLAHMPTRLDSTAPPPRDGRRPHAASAVPVMAGVPVTDSTDLVSRALAILTQETDVWHARRSAYLPPGTAR